MPEAGSFIVNGVELGLASESTAAFRAGRLNAELRAILSPTETTAWALSPPLLYFRAVRLPEVVPLRMRVDDDLLDEYDIGIYLGEHHDAEGSWSSRLDSSTSRGCAASTRRHRGVWRYRHHLTPAASGVDR